MRRGPSFALLTVVVCAYIGATALSQAPRALEVSRGLAQRHLDTIAAKRGQPEDVGRREVRAWIDDDGKSHHHVQQLHRGVPVFGGEAIAHLDSDGELEGVIDDFIDDPQPIDVTPTLTATEAITFAIAAAGLTDDVLTADPRAELWIVPNNRDDRDGPDHLAYRVQLRREDGSLETSMPVVFIDAHDGSVVAQYDNLQTGSVTVSGTSTYYGSLSVTGFQNGVTFYLEDIGRKIGVFNFNNGTTSIFRTSDADGVYNATNQKAMMDAHLAATASYDYFKNVHGRIGIDNSGGPAYVTSIDGVTGLISSVVHYSTNYSNAFWNGQYMTYGDGDGSTFTSLTTLDIGGHELTHGVTERTAGLIYSGESGALNESMSDVFGAMIERSVLGESANTWKIGELAYTPANGTGDALRYMDNPHLASNSGFTSDDDPDHYAERYTGTSDNGGVHINSGIANKAFYLVAKGGTHHLGGSMTGIGADVAAAIWYKALTNYMTSTTNFAGARTATLNAAAAIYGNGSTNYNAVCQAWTMVGVGSSCTAPPPPPPSNGLLDNGSFESSVAPWVMSGTGAFYTNNGNFPHSGTGYIYLGTGNSVTGQVYQQVSIPSGTSPALTFYLDVTSAETTTITPYDKLFVEIRNSAGTLLGTLATYSNLSKTATAGSYSQKSLSLASFAGQTIRIQFRVTTDSSAITTFRVDDVCAGGCDFGGGGPGPTSTAVSASPASPTYGTAVTFTATVAGSGACVDPAGTVAFTDGGTAMGSVPLNAANQAALTTSTLAGGSHTIQATYSSSTGTCTGSSGSVSTTVAKASQTISFGGLGNKTFGDAPFAVNATASSGLPVTFSIASGPATIIGNTVTITGVGEVTVRASQAGNGNYNAATPVDQLFTVAKANQTISFGALANKTFGDPAFALNATSSSGLPVSFGIVSGPATLAGATLTITGAGPITVRASQAGNGNYNAAAAVEQSFTVAKANQTIKFGALAHKVFGDDPFVVSAVASSGLVVSFSVVSGPASLGAGNVVTITGAGTVVIRASQSGDSNYNPANDVDRSFTVGQPGQTITFGELGDVTYGVAPISLAASASSGLPVEFAVVSGPAAIAGSVLSVTGAGTIVVRASQPGDSNIAAADPIDQSFTSLRAPLTVTVASVARGYWDADPVFGGSIAGIVNDDNIGAAFEANTTSDSPAGTYPIGATLLDPGNRLQHYSVTTLPGVLTIVNPAPAIGSLAPTSVAVGGGDLLLDVSGQDFVPQTTVSLNGTPLTTTFVSRTLVRAAVPAANLAAVGVSFITASQDAPGGGVSAASEFFVTNTGSPVIDADTGSSDDEDGTADASVGGTGAGTPDSVSVSAEGEGSVTVAQFEANPGPPVTFQSTDAFFDVFVPPTSAFTSLTILSCDLNGGNVVQWSDGASWMPVSNQAFDPNTGCVTILIDENTSPSLSQLTGTFFAASSDAVAPATAAAATLADGSAYTFGASANGPVTVSLHATDNAGGAGVMSLSAAASGATTIPLTTVPGANGALTISADGETTITFYSTDAAGNVEGTQTRIVRIDREAPAASAQASPGELWPPNGKTVPVTISGQVSDAAGIASASYAVNDEYGEVSTGGSVTLAADGSYRFTVMLPASRLGSDLDGRTFAIRVDATDRAGNVVTAEALVVVPHSQGQ